MHDYYQKYNEFNRREPLFDEKTRKITFKSYSRSLGGFLPPKKSASILDVACGEGSLLLYLQSLGYNNLAGFDLSELNVAICHKLRLPFVRQFDALDVEKYTGTKYDLIFALDLIEHFPHDTVPIFLRSIKKILNKNGMILIQTPNMGSLYGVYHRYNDFSHRSGFTENSVISLLMFSGFENNEIQVFPAWNATTILGYMREKYLSLLHLLFYLGEDRTRPIVPTKNIIVKAINMDKVE
jgi:2-polyprenyl-3-methyl-5-hydroxy-6-metoxy-1,4-benzoquinol methylase